MAFPADKLTRIVAIRWGDHPFLALPQAGDGGSMGVSDDGIEWTAVGGYDGPALNVGARGNGMFLAANFPTGQLRQSVDGEIWEAVPGNPFVGMVVSDIVFGNDRFMVVGLDAATQKVVTVATLSQGADGSDVWSSTVLPPLTGSQYIYRRAGFSAGQFFIFGAESFSGTFRDVIGYDFALNQVQYSSPYTAIWTRSRLTRSADGLSWGALEEPFFGLDGGSSGTVTITDPAPPHSQVTLPKTDPDISQISTDCAFIAQNVPPGGRVVVAQQTNVPAQSFAVYSGGGWSISPSDVRNVNGGLAYGAVLSGDSTIDRFVALGTDVDANRGYLTSGDGMSWQFTPEGDLPAAGFAAAAVIVFGENLFVSANGSAIYYSARGEIWTQANQRLGVTRFATAVYGP